MKTMKKVLAIILSLIFTFGCMSVMVAATDDGPAFTDVQFNRKTKVLSWTTNPKVKIDRIVINAFAAGQEFPEKNSFNISNILERCSDFCDLELIAINDDEESKYALRLRIAVNPDEKYISRVDIEYTGVVKGKTPADYEEFVKLNSSKLCFIDRGVIFYPDVYSKDFAEDYVFDDNQAYPVTLIMDTVDDYYCDSFTEFYFNGKKNSSTCTRFEDGMVTVSYYEPISVVESNFFTNIINAIKDFFAGIAEFFRNLFVPKK